MTLGKNTRKMMHISMLIMLSALILIFCTQSAAAAPHQQTIDCAATTIPQAECEALLALHLATTGASWTDDTDWTDPVNPCTWFGVTCTGTNVTGLSLPGNNLVGTLPTEIGDLTSLITFDLSGNAALTGVLPASMTSLTALTTFDYSATDLCEPQESAFQLWLGLVTTVTNSGILCQIDCSHADTTIDDLQCDALVAIYNSTAGDSWIDKTNWLYAYDVCTWYGVSCSGINITDLILINNNLVGSLPGEIGDFPYMTTLNLLRNSLSGTIPGQIQSLVRLSILNLGRNNLSGTLPNSIGNMSLLTSMDLRRNAFTGQVPVSFVNLTNLNYLDTTNSTLCLPSALNSWYSALTHIDTLPPCVIPPTSTNTPVPSATNSGTAKPPTSTPLPTNTPTITYTPTITPTPTLVFPLQTLTQLAREATILATRNSGFRTATTAATATSYYNIQASTETQAAIDATEEGSIPGGGSEQGGSQSGGNSGGGLGGMLSKLMLWGAAGLVLIGGGLGLFLFMRRRKDDNSSPTSTKKESEFESFL